MSEREDLGGVTIGAREIYDAVVATREDVRSLTQTHESVAQTLTDHEDRLRGLERWKYALPVAAVTSAGTLITAALKATGKV
ncbi:hypothetical protein HOS58_gp21 [Streptomyces phage Attoomi]|uniref:Uncharacterized protein n=1 Tax=Streptomyces phage Attoomi TaxID=2059881 RepID=A0A2H5BLH6_9CAUD|nr:hypothetical protein HOS58_gp21 [Streptomyces phage Attoomi]AUG87153.1 hypothetical protein SEA_ATTOOMI_21 [Streptomyces phage Attoomi]